MDSSHHQTLAAVEPVVVVVVAAAVEVATVTVAVAVAVVNAVVVVAETPVAVAAKLAAEIEVAKPVLEGESGPPQKATLYPYPYHTPE